MKARPMAIALALALAACTVPGVRASREALPAVAPAPSAQANNPPIASAPDTTYQLLRPLQTGVTQVFDDGHRTFLSFTAEPPPGLMIFDENGQSVAFSAVGPTVVIDAIRQGFLIRTPTASSYAQTRTPERVAQIEAGGASAGELTVLPAQLAAARAEILSMQQRLVGLSTRLDRASRGELAAPLSAVKSDIDEIQTQLDGVNATLVRAHFSSGSALLALSGATQRALLEAARQAQWVRIRGGVDSTGSAALNTKLASARAETLRRLLIEGGVQPDKVSSSAAIDDYVASNATAAGRALNRRVDVFLASSTGIPIHVSAHRAPAAKTPQKESDDSPVVPAQTAASLN